MKLVQRGNKQLRVADDQVEAMRTSGYAEVDARTGKPVRVPAAETEADRLRKENAALKKENKGLTARVRELSARLEAAPSEAEG